MLTLRRLLLVCACARASARWAVWSTGDAPASRNHVLFARAAAQQSASAELTDTLLRALCGADADEAASLIKALSAANTYRHRLDAPVCVGDATPLEAAVQAWRLDTATVLLRSGATATSRALDIALMAGSSVATQLLLDYDAKLMHGPDPQAWPPGLLRNSVRCQLGILELFWTATRSEHLDASVCASIAQHEDPSADAICTAIESADVLAAVSLVESGISLATATCDGMDAASYAIHLMDEQANVALTAIQYAYYPL